MSLRVSKLFLLTSGRLVFATLLACGTARSGEKIQGLEPREAPMMKAPSRERTPGVFSPPRPEWRPGDAGGDEIAPVIPKPSPNSRSLDPRFEEIDKKRNWLFDSPSDYDRNAETRKALGVRKDYNPDPIQAKPKSAMDRRFESDAEDRRVAGERWLERERGSQSGSDFEGREGANKEGLSDSDSPSMLSPISLKAVGLGSSDQGERGLSSLPGDMKSRLPGALGSGGSFQSFSPDMDRSTGGKLSPSDQRIQKMINPTRETTGLFIDPANARKSGVLSPFSGSSAGGSEPGLGAGLSGAGGSPAPSISGASPVMGVLNPSGLGGASFGASPVPASVAPIMRPQPPVLQMPRRKL